MLIYMQIIFVFKWGGKSTQKFIIFLINSYFIKSLNIQCQLNRKEFTGLLFGKLGHPYAFYKCVLIEVNKNNSSFDLFFIISFLFTVGPWKSQWIQTYVFDLYIY